MLEGMTIGFPSKVISGWQPSGWPLEVIGAMMTHTSPRFTIPNPLVLILHPVVLLAVHRLFQRRSYQTSLGVVAG